MERNDRRRKRLDRQAEREAGVSGSQPEPIKSLKDLGRFKQSQTTPDELFGRESVAQGTTKAEPLPASDRMTEEELLRGLKGLSPSEDVDRGIAASAPAAEGGNLDAEAVLAGLKKKWAPEDAPPAREVPHPDAPGLSFQSGARAAALGRSGIKNELPKLRRSDEDMEDTEKLGDQWADDRPKRWGEGARKRYFAAGKREGYAPLGKMGAAAPGSAEKKGNAEVQNAEREARVNAAFDFFTEKTARGASPTYMYQLVENSLSKDEIPALRARVDKEWDLNGTTGDNIPDLVSIGKSEKDVTANLGRKDGEVERAPYWRLPDGSVAILSNAVVRRIAADGIDKLGGKTYRWDRAAGFVPMSEDDIKKWRAAGPERARRMRTSARETVPDIAPEPAPEPSEPPPVLSEDEYQGVDEEKFLEGSQVGVLEKGKRTVGQAHAVFSRMQYQNMPLANSYRQAIEGLKDADRREFEDNLFDAGIVPFALLDAIIRDENKKRTPERAATPVRSTERRRGTPTRERQAAVDEWQPPFGKGWEVVE